MKQALAEQRMYGEQENNHPEWPDHTLSKGLRLLDQRKGLMFMIQQVA